MKIYDISWPISPNSTTYKNRNQYHLTQTKRLEYDGVEEHCVTMNVHMGTHVDAPSHMIEKGDPVGSISLEQLIGPSRVIDMTHIKNAISAQDLVGSSSLEGQIVLFKTSNSAIAYNAPFNPNFVFLDESAATMLTEMKVRAVGIDYLGIERNQPNHPTHQTLMKARIPIIEGLRLEHVPAGAYTCICLPIRLLESEAAPARTVLFPPN
jgi:arylformamidase